MAPSLVLSREVGRRPSRRLERQRDAPPAKWDYIASLEPQPVMALRAAGGRSSLANFGHGHPRQSQREGGRCLRSAAPWRPSDRKERLSAPVDRLPASLPIRFASWVARKRNAGN